MIQVMPKKKERRLLILSILIYLFVISPLFPQIALPNIIKSLFE